MIGVFVCICVVCVCVRVCHLSLLCDHYRWSGPNMCLCMASVQLLRVHCIFTPCSVEKDGKDKKKPAAVILNSSPSEPMKLVTAVVKNGPSESTESITL